MPTVSTNPSKNSRDGVDDDHAAVARRIADRDGERDSSDPHAMMLLPCRYASGTHTARTSSSMQITEVAPRLDH